MQCDRSLDFQPRQSWPEVLPALAWRGYLLSGFNRRQQRGTGEAALDLSEANLVDVMKAAYAELSLGEMARCLRLLQLHLPAVYAEFREPLLNAYGWRWSERLQETLDLLLATPLEFQAWVDEKKTGPRDLASLLALPQIEAFLPFLSALARLSISKSEGVRALELGVELFLMGRELSDLLPSGENPGLYLRQLEKWRRPRAAGHDEHWREDVSRWPWPSHVQGRWQRFGDEAGLEIKIRTTSPQDFLKQLERLHSIRETWSCKS
jgi:hypothetical protein